MGQLKSKQVYNRDYYICQALLRNKGFMDEINRFRRKLIDFGCGIPRDGFKNLAQYKSWENKLITKTQRSFRRHFDQLFQNLAIKSIEIGNKDFGNFMISKTFIKFVRSLLFKPKFLSEANGSPLSVYIFSGESSSHHEYGKPVMQPGFYIQILPEIHKEDILRNWGYIQKFVQDWLNKNPDKISWIKQNKRNRFVPLAIDVMEEYFNTKLDAGVDPLKGRLRARMSLLKSVQNKLAKKGKLISTSNIKRIIKNFGYLKWYMNGYFKQLA